MGSYSSCVRVVLARMVANWGGRCACANDRVKLAGKRGGHLVVATPFTKLSSNSFPVPWLRKPIYLTFFRCLGSNAET